MKKISRLMKVLEGFSEGDDGLLVKWNRMTGEFSCDYAGRPISLSALTTLLEACMSGFLSFETTPEGNVDWTKPKSDSEMEKREEQADNVLPFKAPWMKEESDNE